jgi:hypothetical protein
MARRTFEVIDVTEILMHWHAGRSKNEMAQSLGVDRKTLRKYIAPAEAAGISPGGPAKSEQEWAGLVRAWFPQLADTRLRKPACASQKLVEPRSGHRSIGSGCVMTGPNGWQAHARSGGYSRVSQELK